MLIWRSLAEANVPAGSVVTIGNFDGVHLGHRAVLERVVSGARGLDTPTASATRPTSTAAVAVTFDPHPVSVHRPGADLTPLTTLDQRLELLAAAGIDATLVIPYNLDFAALTPEAFVQDFLVDGLRARAVVLGHDVRFGAGNTGTLATMRSLGREFGFSVETVDDVGPDGSRISSSEIRRLLTDGDVAQANEQLGRPYSLTSVVVHGDARGRTIGFPTANLGELETLIPADGVYAGFLGQMPAAISIGTNPTFTDGPERRVEAHVLDRDDLELYGETVTLTFVERLRPSLKFDGVEALVAQMNLDVSQCREVLAART